MDKVIEAINKEFNNDLDFLKLYEVIYDYSNMECMVTFLYPQTLNDIPQVVREKLQNFLSNYLDINGKVVVKFKKSFLDERLIKKEVYNFITNNYKAIGVYLGEDQIQIPRVTNDIVDIKIYFTEDLFNYFQSSDVKSELIKYLGEKFISNFNIEVISSKDYKIDTEIKDVDIPVVYKKNKRYNTFIIENLFGGTIAPSPEFFEDNKEPKEGVILAGKIEMFQKKTYIKKKGKQAGEEGVYYNFILNDNKKIDCVYFSTKTNVSKMDLLADGMTILCLGDLRKGLADKLTYYIKRISIVNIDEESKKLPVNKISKNRKNVVLPEVFEEHKQTNLFSKNVKYDEFILKNNIVVFDLETTGIDTANDKIIEIGAVKIEKGRVISKFSTFINPQIHIPDEATKVNNITDEMVADAPLINDVIYDFLEYCNDCIVSGYNNINFDNKFIAKVANELNINFNNEMVDVFNLVRQKSISAKNYKLGTVAESLGIDLSGAHRAYNDAYATAQILLKLYEIE